jgi:hypothetical protein
MQFSIGKVRSEGRTICRRPPDRSYDFERLELRVDLAAEVELLAG